MTIEDIQNEIIEEFVLEKVKQIRKEQKRCGGRKMYLMICKDPEKKLYKFGRKRFFEILKKHDLLVKKRKRRAITTDSRLWRGQYPDLVKELIPSRPEQVWVADITYLPTVSGNTYLSLVTDAYSRKIVGYHLDNNMRVDSVKQAFSKALVQRQTSTPLIHHSDRGIQYCSHEYQQLHQQYHTQCSMTDGYDCYQNALAERVNGILKSEYLLVKPKDLTEARKMVEESIMIYNQRRPHTALKYKTPDEVHQAF